MKFSLAVGVIALLAVGSNAQWNSHQWSGRSGIVNLFEWKWTDIALECERFLAPNGYAGVQTSPVNENVVVEGRPWWERYQPISYRLETRSGTEAQFRDMVHRCNNVGVRIYVDIVINHMSADHTATVLGTNGSTANPSTLSYPAVPYSPSDFNAPCDIENYEDSFQVRRCKLADRQDLNQGILWVRDRINDFLDHLVEIGVAGFRVDSAKYMFPADLQAIYNRVRNLNTAHGFPAGSRPFIIQEFTDYGNTYKRVTRDEYFHLGTITEKYSSTIIGNTFRGRNELRSLRNWGLDMGLMADDSALIFVDNHYNQRGLEEYPESILTYKEARQYRMATAFLLAHSYGSNVRLMSSFAFTNTDTGPPQDGAGNIISPSILADGTCGNGWVCEHRWRQIHQMIDFRNVVAGTEVENWWESGRDHIAFCRGNRGFIMMSTSSIGYNFQTCLPAGQYCDIISGRNNNGVCSGITVNVDANGVAYLFINANSEDGMIAIHVGALSRVY